MDFFFRRVKFEASILPHNAGLVRRAEFHKTSADFCELNINFAPHLLQLFIKGRLSDLGNNGIDLSELFPGESVAQLKEKLAGIPSQQMPEIIRAFLMPFLRSEHVDPRIVCAHEMIASCVGERNLVQGQLELE